jgi:hypothetical protein
MFFPYCTSPSTHPYKSQFHKQDLKRSFMWKSQQELRIMTYLSHGIMTLPLLVARSKKHNPKWWFIAHCTTLSGFAHKIQGYCLRHFPYTIIVKLFEESNDKISSSKPWQTSIPITSSWLSSYVFLVHGNDNTKVLHDPEIMMAKSIEILTYLYEMKTLHVYFQQLWLFYVVEFNDLKYCIMHFSLTKI